MRNPKNNLFYNHKHALLMIVTLILLFGSVMYILFFKEKKSEIPEEVVIDIISLKLSILNGCGVLGAASQVKDHFIDQDHSNIDIISWENVESNKFIYGKSIIVVKRKDEIKLKYLMRVTGITRKIYAVDENAIEDFQIILGRDFRSYFK